MKQVFSEHGVLDAGRQAGTKETRSFLELAFRWESAHVIKTKSII